MQELEDSTERKNAFERDWTKGSVIRNLLALSWPVIVSESVWIVVWMVDMVWVGKLGAASIAGVGVAMTIVMLTIMADMGLIEMGARAMVARFVGAGDTASANRVLGQGFILSAVLSVVMTATGVIFAEPILGLFGLEPDVIAEGAVYMRVMFAGWVTIACHWLVYGLMQSSGDTITPMKIVLFVMCVHLAICPFLVLGWAGFPRMGVGGAAIANIGAEGLGLFVCLWVLFTGRTRLRLTLADFRPDLNIMWRILKIGLPACVMSVQRSLGGLVLTWVMVPFGTLAVAAHSLGMTIQATLMWPGVAFGMGAAVLVGQNMGARQPERAERSGWLTAFLVQGFMLTCAVVVLVWAEGIIRIFNTEPDLVELASLFLRISAAGYLMMGFTSVLQQCLFGAGDTVPPMLVGLVTLWAVQLPLAFLLPEVANLGVYGVRWAMVAGIVVGGVAYVAYFRLGRWKRKIL